MEDFLTISMTIAASAISILTLLFTKKIDKNRDKIFKIQDEEGKTEEIVVPASSSQVEIQKTFLDMKDFEKHVGEILKDLVESSSKEISLMHQKIGDDKIDFIIPELGIGFEVKNKISYSNIITTQHIAHKENLKHVYLIEKNNENKISTSAMMQLKSNDKVSVMHMTGTDTLAADLKNLLI